MSAARSYLRGVIAPELHAQYVERSARANTELMQLQADALMWFADSVESSSDAERLRLILRAPRTVQLVDVRVSPKIAECAKESASSLGVSVRQWVYSALTLYGLRSFN